MPWIPLHALKLVWMMKMLYTAVWLVSSSQDWLTAFSDVYTSNNGPLTLHCNLRQANAPMLAMDWHIPYILKHFHAFRHIYIYWLLTRDVNIINITVKWRKKMMAARDNERMVFFSQQRVKSLTDTTVFKWMTGQPEALISGGGQYTHEYSNTNSSYHIQTCTSKQ